MDCAKYADIEDFVAEPPTDQHRSGNRDQLGRDIVGHPLKRSIVDPTRSEVCIFFGSIVTSGAEREPAGHLAEITIVGEPDGGRHKQLENHAGSEERDPQQLAPLKAKHALSRWSSFPDVSLLRYQAD